MVERPEADGTQKTTLVFDGQTCQKVIQGHQAAVRLSEACYLIGYLAVIRVKRIMVTLIVFFFILSASIL